MMKIIKQLVISWSAY